jgi:hypothetical protein
MPKREILHPAGTQTPNELKSLLDQFFSKKDIIRLERLGGRVFISLTIPFNPRKKTHTKIEIGESFIAQLRELRDVPIKLKDLLLKLSTKQLRKLGISIGHPLRTKSAKNELVEELVTHLHGEEVWRQISGSK